MLNTVNFIISYNRIRQWCLYGHRYYRHVSFSSLGFWGQVRSKTDQDDRSSFKPVENRPSPTRYVI